MPRSRHNIKFDRLVLFMTNTIKIRSTHTSKLQALLKGRSMEEDTLDCDESTTET